MFNINSQNGFSTIYAYGGSGNDKLVVGPEVMATNAPPVVFYGEGGTDTLELDGSTLGLDQSFILFGNAIQRFLPASPFASETQFDSTVETFNIKGGAGNDTFQVLGIAANQTVNVIGNGGADTFRVGKDQTPPFALTFSGNILGTINVSAGQGDDLLYVDDVGYTQIANGISINSTSISNPTIHNNVTFDSALERLELHASNVGSRFITVFGLPAVTSLSLFGGTGVGDTLIIDDRTIAVAPYQLNLGANYYEEYYGTAQSPTVRQLRPNHGI